jgi:hypothetical protein
LVVQSGCDWFNQLAGTLKVLAPLPVVLHSAWVEHKHLFQQRKTGE